MPTDSPASSRTAPGDAAGAPQSGRATGTHVWDRIRTSLASRMALTTTAVALLAVLTVGAVAWPLLQDAGLRQARAELGRQADLAALLLSRPADAQRDLQLQALRQTLEARGTTAVPFTIPLTTAQQGELAAYGLSPADYQALYAGAPVSVVAGSGDQRDIVEARPIWVGGGGPAPHDRDDDDPAHDRGGRRGVTPTGAIVLTQNVSDAGGAVASSMSRLAVAMLVGLGLAALVGWLLARRLARPLQRAAAAAERMSEGERDIQVEPEGPTEVADVAVALNRLNAALTVSEARQRDFLLSVSHELRTPMTSIRGYAEALADGVVPEQDIPRTAMIMAAESERLDMLVADLLELARLGSVKIPVNTARVDLTELVRNAGEIWSDRCEEEGLPFSIELPDAPLIADTDPLRVRQIIDNLAANALRVTPAGQPLVISLRADGPWRAIEVRDGGPGLTADDCAVAFEPAELHSRYQGIRKVGSGVGLALVGRLAALLGGTAEAGAAPEGGAKFTVRLPSQTPDFDPAAATTPPPVSSGG